MRSYFTNYSGVKSSRRRRPAKRGSRLRRRMPYSGRGKFTFKDFTRKLRKGIAAIPAPIKDMIKNKAIEAISGLGSYSMNGQGLYGGQGKYVTNQLIEGGRAAPRTFAANDETDEITVSDNEYVADIFAPTIAVGTASSSFAQQSFPLNPGIPLFAPNLSQLAINFTEYELIQCVYELKPVINESNVNNGLTGIALMVFNYNPNDDPYDNKEDVMQAHGSVSSKITDNIVCGVECDPKKTNRTKFFVRSGPVPYQKDADEYDPGVLVIATNNIPQAFSNLQIFELWVSYKVKLRKRKGGALRLLNQSRDVYVCVGNVNGDKIFSDQVAAVGATGIGASQQNSVGTALTTTATGSLTVTFPAALSGNYEIIFTSAGTLFTNTAGNSFNLTTTGNISAISDLYGTDTPGNFIGAFSSTGLTNVSHFKVRSATGGVNNTIVFKPNLASTAQVANWQLIVQEITNANWTNRTTPKPLLLNIYDTTVIS